MTGQTEHRLLSIGEFAAATQLTRKALRLYDEQGLLRPASTDRVTGYRFFSGEQVRTGRLIRALRNMNLSLHQISRVLDAGNASRDLVLRQFSHEAEQRYVREKAAYQAALAMMRSPRSSASFAIEDVARGTCNVSVWGFTSDRRRFIRSYFEQQETALAVLATLHVSASAHTRCALLDPLGDEEGRMELLIPIEVSTATIVRGITTREIARGRCAVVKLARPTSADGLTPAIDALFDWFDRRGFHALGAPEVSLVLDHEEATASVQWSFGTP